MLLEVEKIRAHIVLMMHWARIQMMDLSTVTAESKCSHLSHRQIHRHLQLSQTDALISSVAVATCRSIQTHQVLIGRIYSAIRNNIFNLQWCGTTKN